MKKIEIEIPDSKRVEWVNGVLTLVDDNSKYSNETVKYYSECLGLDKINVKLDVLEIRPENKRFMLNPVSISII